MATFLELTSGLFCLRPFTWIMEKIIKGKRRKAFFLEFFYLLLSVWYSFLWFGSIPLLRQSLAYLSTYFLGMFGLMATNYGIFHYHKRTDEDMGETVHKGYKVSGTVNLDKGDLEDVTVTDVTANELTFPALFAVLLAPLLSIIRFVNVIRIYTLFSRDCYCCDLVEHEHPGGDGIFFAIVNDFTDANKGGTGVDGGVETVLGKVAWFGCIVLWIWLVVKTINSI